MLYNKNVTISDAEMEVMRIFWDAEKPLTSNEIIDRLNETKWNQSTILTLIKRLHEKGALTLSDPYRQRNKTYAAGISEGDYKKVQTFQFIDKVFAGSAKGMLATLFDSDGMTENELQQIKEWLDERSVK